MICVFSETMPETFWHGQIFLSGQVSSVTDHVGAQDTGAKAADFDDDDGGGLVSSLGSLFRLILLFLYQYLFFIAVK